MRVIYGVTTYNRLEVLKRNIESWESTRDKDISWTLIICDDGSTDGTKDYISELKFDNVDIIKKFNDRIGIGAQINQIFGHSCSIDYQYAFRSDDDVEFLKRGWENLYISSINRSRYPFLCHFDVEWAYKYRNATIIRKPTKVDQSRGIQCSVRLAHDGMGAFWTFTPAVISRIGYMDVVDVGIWGNEHTDYAMRCCRARFNDLRNLWDAIGSEAYVRLQKENYESSINETEKSNAMSYGPDPVSKWKKINDHRRIYVPFRLPIVNMRGERAKESQ